jgi:hypothetical protein
VKKVAVGLDYPQFPSLEVETGRVFVPLALHNKLVVWDPRPVRPRAAFFFAFLFRKVPYGAVCPEPVLANGRFLSESQSSNETPFSGCVHAGLSLQSCPWACWL